MTTKEFEIQYALGSLTDDMKINLAYNKRTSKKILTILSKDESWNVRYWVAYNINTPKEILKKLSTDEDSNVRYYAANNPNNPIEVLKKLSKDENWGVKYKATNNIRYYKTTKRNK